MELLELFRKVAFGRLIDKQPVGRETYPAVKSRGAVRVLARFLGLNLLLTVLAGCGGVEVEEDLRLSFGFGGNSRPFQMSASAVQMLPIPGRAFSNGNDLYPIDSLSANVDVITIVPEYYGIPFDIFALGPTISESHPWTVRMTALLREVEAAGRPVILYLGFVRRSLVGLARDNDGELEVDITWAPSCYDFSLPEAEEIGDAYVNYTRWMTSRFRPAYVVNFVEANLYYEECGGSGAAWDRLVDIQRRAYDAIKQEKPGTEIMTAFLLETLYEDELDGWDEAQYLEMARMKYDIFGMATYPFGRRFSDGSFVTPFELPSDYLFRVRSKHPEVKRLAITETGWNSVSISVGDEVECLENFPYSEVNFVSAYLEELFNTAHREEFELVTWFSFRNVMPDTVVGTCYDDNSVNPGVCLGDPWCEALNFAKQNVRIPGEPALFTEVVLKSFGAMGLQSYAGTDKPVIAKRWSRELALPLE